MNPSASQPGLPGCVLIATGGTIASRIDARTGLAVPANTGAELIEAVPRLASVARVRVDEFGRIPSPHITPDDWVGLHGRVLVALADDDCAGIVIAHGTGMMEETAWFLDLTVQHDKPVVLTGAQRNASEPDFDGARNLLDAVRFATSPRTRGMGVLLALNGHLNAAREVMKTHSLDVETFNSGEWGYLGGIVGEQVLMHRAPQRRLHLPLQDSALPRVEIVSMYAGADGALVDAAASLAPGIVIQAVGTGHVNPPMYRAIRAALERGVEVVISTRIPRGGTKAGYGMEGSSHSLAQAGAILAGDLSAWKARILLMLALQNKHPRAGLQALFDH